jgi:hypothetical protein
LLLLRHNFAVLAFSKHYLSVDSATATPEEDALYHLLGAGQAKQVLALVRGEARDTLCVKPVEEPPLPSEINQELLAEAGSVVLRNASATSLTGIEEAPQPAIYSHPAPDVSPPISSEWGLPADSPVVTGNPGMFYKDAKGRTQPYTWAEFMAHFSRRVKAKRQPDLVRAKYGVGFELSGGDSPERAFNPKKQAKTAELTHTDAGSALVPEAMLFGPLNRDETRWYRRRLAELVNRGEDRPTDTLPPQALAALRHLRMLPSNAQDSGMNSREVSQALRDFRRKVGKDEPDDPAHSGHLMPAERVALELYDQRLARYAAIQSVQQASLDQAPDLNQITQRPAWQRRYAMPYIAELQRALAAQELLKQPRKKTVWRDKRGRKRVKYKTLSFTGKVDKKTLSALSTFQSNKGLRNTKGALDCVSLRLLGLAPMGLEIFLPPVGPQCAKDETTTPVLMCEIRPEHRWNFGTLLDWIEPGSKQRLFASRSPLFGLGEITELDPR